MTDAATDTSTEAEQATRGATAPVSAAATTIERPGSLPTKAQHSTANKDKTLTSPGAVEMALGALAEITDPLSVGAHTGARSEAERVVTHLFECNLAGYRGWRWAVTMTRPPRSRTATVCEMELLPGEDALLAPAWVPWADRLQPGDVGRGDRLPRRETDGRLEPGWEATGEHDGDQTGADGLLATGTDAVDFGRARVLSPEGIQRAADRWYGGDHGPEADGVRKAHATCSTCGFFLPMSGPLRNVFGVCANEWAADDGRVVSLDHGCGAHSETDVPDQGPDWPVAPSRLDEAAMEPIGSDGHSVREGRSLDQQQAEDSSGDPARESSSDADAPADGDASAHDDSGRRHRRRAGGSGDDDAPTRRRGRGSAAREDRAAAVPATSQDTGESAALDAESQSGSQPGSESLSGSGGESGADEGPAPRSRRASARRSAEPRETEDAAAAGPDQQRHSAALDAVAELTASRGHAEDDGADGVPTTLAELEAHLPRRE